MLKFRVNQIFCNTFIGRKHCSKTDFSVVVR